MREGKYKVYMHTLPNGKKYVGITSQEVKERWENGKGYISNKRFYNAILKYGWENIKHEILFIGLDQEEAYKKEIELIKINESNNPKYGYNQTEGGANANYCLIKQDPMPPLELIYKDAFKLDLFKHLISACDYQKVIETTTIITYDENGKEIKEIIKNEKIIEPSIIAINIILDNYENEERLKPLIDRLKVLKEKLDD